ncbi:PilZ domain-containing protein [Mariprofundus ferrinatatus]|uniref:PilZ domain-containing protein n=1 Tax=Mariprofundus ferrinatatus TaxID=1921087 RepID=A0A2K8L7Z1_9PROT|nr:PilZ domain-containing protein [Mariprofundus ferrinatatus]ATX82369.1 PilZ domain-containing protein [Mariprofundus ferrinatatus]
MGFLNRQVFLLGNLVERLWPFNREAGTKMLLSHGGDTDEFYSGSEKRRHVRFPVSLSVRHNLELPLLCKDYVLNASKGGVFIQCEDPFPVDTILILHFYIPPEEKLLAEFSGEVTEISDGSKYAAGMHIKFFHYSDEDMKRFLSYLEESKKLLDVNG